MKTSLLIVPIVLTVATATAFGQRTQPVDPNNPLPPWVQRVEEKRDEQDRRAGRDTNGMINRRDPTRVEPPVYRYPSGKPYSIGDLEMIKKQKAPDPAIEKKYEKFLKRDDTGIFKLFTFLPCVDRYVVRADGECIRYVPDSWGYSFRKKNYAANDFFDIRLKDGVISTGGALTFSVMTVLGDVALDDLDLKSNGIALLRDLKPETVQADAEKQIRTFINGVDDNGYRYALNARAMENRSFALRVVAFQAPGNVQIFARNLPRYPIDLNRYDVREDVIIVFRIVKTDTADITIIWKELRRTGAPKLKFPKEMKTAEIAPVD